MVVSEVQKGPMDVIMVLFERSFGIARVVAGDKSYLSWIGVLFAGVEEELKVCKNSKER
jgi:hypothetical protein